MGDDQQRIDRLQAQVRLLAAGLGLVVDDPEQAISQIVIDRVRQGEKVAAVRYLVRDERLSLRAAKRIVDAVPLESRAAPHESREG